MSRLFPPRRWLAAVVCGSALLVGCGGGGDASVPLAASTSSAPSVIVPVVPPVEPPVLPPTVLPSTVLAISASPQLDPYPRSGDQFAALAEQAFQMVWGAGARGQMTTYHWRELEPVSGRFQNEKLSDMDRAVSRAHAHGMVQYLGIQIINTTAREMPEGLAHLPFDDAAVKARFRALLDRVIVPHRGRIRYLSIGNEVDVYLRANPTQWTRYRRFYEDAVRYAKSLDPALRVGVTTTFDGALGQSPNEVSALNALSDVMILTYYPLQYDARRGITVRDPAVVTPDVARMLAWAGARPLLMQEVGYPASLENASSEALQAAFVTEVFKAWRGAGARIPFLNFFLLHDFTPTLCDEFEQYYGLIGVSGFKAFLCSLGLLTDDGRARQAWATLRDEVRSGGLPGGP